MGYWVDLDQAYRTMDPDYVESVWWSLKVRSSTRACWSSDFRITPYCPRCGTGLSDHELASPAATRRSPTRRCTCACPSPPVRWPSSAPTCWSGPPRRGRWCPTPPSPCTPTSPTSRAPPGDGRGARRRRAAAGRGARRGLAEVLAAFPGTELERTTYRAPVRPGRHPRRALRGARPTTSPPRTAPAWCTRRPRSAPTTSRDLQRYGLPVVNPVEPDGRFEAESRWSAACSSRTPTRALIADLRARGLLFRGAAVRAQLPALLALPHRAALLRAARPGTSGPPRSRTGCSRRTSSTNWYPETIKHGRYGEWLRNNVDWALSRQPLLGHPAAAVASARDEHVTCVGSLAELGELAGRTCPRSTRTGRSSTTSRFPARPAAQRPGGSPR